MFLLCNNVVNCNTKPGDTRPPPTPSMVPTLLIEHLFISDKFRFKIIEKFFTFLTENCLSNNIILYLYLHSIITTVYFKSK